MRKKKNVINYSVIYISPPLSGVTDYETYALFHPNNAGHKLDRFVKITNTNTNKSIYRKCWGRNGILGNQVALAYKTQKELDIQHGSSVDVQSAGFWGYYWNNSESYLKWTFRIGALGFGLTVLTLIITLTKELVCLITN